MAEQIRDDGEVRFSVRCFGVFGVSPRWTRIGYVKSVQGNGRKYQRKHFPDYACSCTDPVQLESLPDKQTRVGRVAAFLCTLYEGEEVHFAWSKDGTLLKSSGRIQIQSNAASSTLTIQRVESRDAGNYTCIGSNPVSEERVSARLSVQGELFYHLNQIYFYLSILSMCPQ